LDTGTECVYRLSQLQDKFNVLKEQHAQLSETIRTARVVSGEAQGFVDGAKIQAERLESIGLFIPSATEHGDCPLCAQHLAVPTPAAEAIQASLSQLSQSLSATERERPRLREYIGGLNEQMEALLAREAEKEEVINALLNEQQTAQQLRDQNSRQAKVVGRLSLYLESVHPRLVLTG
jgi:DNA repair exonuclease SbcCD ATPase subunit